MKYKKKPVVIEALQFDGTEGTFGKIANAFGVQGLTKTRTTNGTFSLVISTADGPLIASPKDWIIRGVGGCLYPCKSEVFGTTYEAAGENAQTTTIGSGASASTN